MVPAIPFVAELGSVQIILQILLSLHCLGHIPWFPYISKFHLIKKFLTFVRVKNPSSANSVLSPSSVFYTQFREFLRVADKTELSKVYFCLYSGFTALM